MSKLGVIDAEGLYSIRATDKKFDDLTDLFEQLIAKRPKYILFAESDNSKSKPKTYWYNKTSRKMVEVHYTIMELNTDMFYGFFNAQLPYDGPVNLNTEQKLEELVGFNLPPLDAMSRADFLKWFFNEFKITKEELIENSDDGYMDDVLVFDPDIYFANNRSNSFKSNEIEYITGIMYFIYEYIMKFNPINCSNINEVLSQYCFVKKIINRRDDDVNGFYDRYDFSSPRL